MSLTPAVRPEKRLKYQEVEDELRKLVSALQVGAKLPSERLLAQSFACNFLTIRRALSPLVNEGIVVRRVGSGTFVLAPPTTVATSPDRHRIGVLVLRSEDTYIYEVLRAISLAANEAGVALSTTWATDFPTDGLDRARSLTDEGCKALILPWLPADQMEQARRFADSCPIPVSLPMIIPGLERLCFEQQEVFGAHAIAAAESIMRYFQRLGHQRIAFLGPNTPSDPILQKKLSAYACHTSRERLTSLCGLVAKNASAMDELADEWKAFRDDLAVVAYDDAHALRLMTAMHKLGLKAPADFRIVGFNNTEASRYSDPPLTTVCQNFDYIGRSLIKSALALAAGEIWQSAEIPRTRLVVRATCKGVRAIDPDFGASLPEIDFVFEPAGPPATLARISASPLSSKVIPA